MYYPTDHFKEIRHMPEYYKRDHATFLIGSKVRTIRRPVKNPVYSNSKMNKTL